MKVSSPHHPIWGIIRITVLSALVLGVLYLNATKFDATEVKAFVEILIAAGAFKGVDAAVTRRISAKQAEESDCETDA